MTGVQTCALPISGLGLEGEHQRENAALAVAAARALAAAGVAIPERAYATGLRRVVWPGRFERVGRRPEVIIDGAHNDASAAALARTLRAMRRRRRLVLVVGLNRDKGARAVLHPLAGVASEIIATRSDDPRAAESNVIARQAARMTRHPVTVAADVGTALALARRRAGATGLVCVAGSLALAGAARTALRLTPRERWW